MVHWYANENLNFRHSDMSNGGQLFCLTTRSFLLTTIWHRSGGLGGGGKTLRPITMGPDRPSGFECMRTRRPKFLCCHGYYGFGFSKKAEFSRKLNSGLTEPESPRNSGIRLFILWNRYSDTVMYTYFAHYLLNLNLILHIKWWAILIAYFLIV